jgi:hypothetical protein
MMALKSTLLKTDKRLQDCAVKDSGHIPPGSTGEHVRKIQAALMQIDKASIEEDERSAGAYGKTTAAAVLAYKQSRDIVNRAYQTQPDNIVGKMTIEALDTDLLERETPVVDKAFGLIPVLRSRIQQAIVRLTTVRTIYALPNPFVTSGKERQLVEWHFKVHRARDPVEQIDKVREIYELMNETVFRAHRFATQWQLFRFSKEDRDSPGAPAYTELGGKYYSITERDQHGEFKNAIYVTPELSNKVFADLILIHELAHYCGGKSTTSTWIGHFATPVPPPQGKPSDDGTTNYADMTADIAYRNVFSYELFCDPDRLGKPPE